MEAKYSFILAFLLTVLIANNIYVFSAIYRPEKVRIFVAEVIDGDTIVSEDGTIMRLLNINTPEKGTSGFDEAKIFLSVYQNHTVEIEKKEFDKYGRTLVKIFTPEYLNLEIVRQGLATKFLVEESELNAFAEAEKSAIDSSLGIWKKSPYFGCFNVRINSEEEVVFIEKKCAEADESEWIIKDESRKEFKFRMPYQKEVNIHSGNGADNSTDLFWNSLQHVWNNDRDTLYLLDSERRIAYYQTYGY